MTASRSSKPSWPWRLMRYLKPRLVRNLRRGIGPTGMVLLLTTQGRKTGQPRVTPLQYEAFGEAIYLGSARGPQADWFRNLQACPQVEVEIHGAHSRMVAEAVTDPARIADFLQLRLERHPWMIGLIMHLEGLPWRYTRSDLERFSAHKALAILHPYI